METISRTGITNTTCPVVLLANYIQRMLFKDVSECAQTNDVVKREVGLQIVYSSGTESVIA
jgi:hypothetical protein